MNKIYFLLSILLVLSCSKNQNTNVKPNPSGKSGEIIVIISDNLWQTNIGDTIFYSLTEPFGVLPQDESIFNVPFVVEEINLNGEYAFVIRGLWHTKNYFMGGPFVSITTLDKDRNRIVTVETFVYAGKQRKKLYLWQVESIIKTLKILN